MGMGLYVFLGGEASPPLPGLLPTAASLLPGDREKRWGEGGRGTGGWGAAGTSTALRRALGLRERPGSGWSRPLAAG